MITLVYSDRLFSAAQVLVCTTSLLGSVETAFKRHFPEMVEPYQLLCQQDHMGSGRLFIHRTLHKWVMALPVRNHPRAAASPDMIEAGLQKFAASFAEYGLTSVAFPDFSDDGLDWENDIRPLVESYLVPLPVTIYIHRPPITSHSLPDYSARVLRRWLNTPPRHVTFTDFMNNLEHVLKQQRDFETLDAPHERFRVTLTTRANRTSIKLLIPTDAPVFISENQLKDLWHYIVRAGYTMPRNLPAGLEAAGEYIVALFSALDTVYPVTLAASDGEPVTGLHYVPPVDRDYESRADTVQVVQS